MSIQEKICTDCNILLPIDRFGSYIKVYVNGEKHRYFQGRCRKCLYIKRKNNPDYMAKQEIYKKSKSITRYKLKLKRKTEMLLIVKTSIIKYFNSNKFKDKKRMVNEYKTNKY